NHPFNINDKEFETLEKNKEQEDEQVLKSFIDEIYHNLQITPKRQHYIVIESVVPHGNIINYAEKGSFDYICVGARGASTLEKYLGTNTINIINKTTIPVFAIPSSYHFQPIQRVVYASDFTALSQEFTKASAFTESLNGEIEILHFAFPSETEIRNQQARELKEKYSDKNIQVNIIPNNALKPIINNIKDYILTNKPSLL